MGEEKYKLLFGIFVFTLVSVHGLLLGLRGRRLRLIVQIAHAV